MGEVARRLKDAPSIEELARLAQESPQDVGAQRQLGWALYADERYQEAVDVLESAAKLDAQDPETLYPLGLANRQAGNQPQAIEAFQATIDHLERIESKTRANMLGRLARGNLNFLNEGRWTVPSAN